MVAWCRRRRAGNAGIVRALFNRQGVAIAGRDGTLAQTGGTGSTALHPTYGSVQSSGALISHNLAIPGVGTLPMSFAQGARTNEVLRSQEFDSGWSTQGLAGTPVLANTATAPDGTTTADTVVISSGASAHGIYRGAVGSIGLTYAFSVYAKAGTASLFQVGGNSTGFGTDVWANFDLLNGVTGAKGASCTSSITHVGNGWYRCQVIGSATVTTTVASGGFFAYFTNSSASGRTPSYTGNGTDTIYLWGAQLEQASFPGLYIPTTSAALTRAADNILWTPPSALSTTSGEVVAIAAPYLWSAGAGAAHPSAANARRWDYLNGSEYDFRGATEGPQRRDVGAQTAFIASLADSSGSLRMTSAKWDASSLGFYRGATLAASDAALTPPWVATPNMNIGATSTPSSHWFGFVGLIYVPGGLTDAERIALASVTGGSLTYVG